ncbi:hypothetical protein G5B35_18095 [Parapusillimonas sp. SGNA-6]|uniref:hypothetical protein n=1 Tax=Parapedobacter sp. SGR-10 TaxID=2710879 RepID=UPI0013D72540|nr:hypothetical protein [Parapedobacter sp. SGR-10]NGF55566.1 hypothetical protein [Parapedobacter sp. SGR-10]NGM89208.1 hypothetical protein [Parapusillimonas sp. SGNA-6]
MFTDISWTDYLTAVFLLLAIYYVYVGVRYYSGDLKDLLSGKRKLNFRASPADSPGGPSPLFMDNKDRPAATAFGETTDDDYTEVEHLIGRLKEVIADASQRQLILQEFRHYLRLTLKEYPAVKISALRASVNKLIVSECEKYGAVTVSAEEVDVLWNDGL